MSPITNVLPLSLVLLVSLIKEAFEDWVSTSFGVFLFFVLFCFILFFNKDCLYCLFFFNWCKQKRFQNDMSINNNLVEVLQDQKWESIPWKKLQVGDIVRVSRQQ